MSKQFTRRGVLATGAAVVGPLWLLLLLFLNSIVLGQTRAQKALYDPSTAEFANSQVLVPSPLKGDPPGAVYNLLFADIVSILDDERLGIAKDGRRITSMDISLKIVDEIIQKNVAVEHEIRQLLYQLGGLHPLENTEENPSQKVVNSVNEYFLDIFLDWSPERRKADLFDARDLQSKLFEVAAEKGITVFDKGSKNYDGSTHRNALLQMIMFQGTIKKIEPEELKIFIRDYSEKFYLAFGQEVDPNVPAGGVVALSYCITAWEVEDLIRRWTRQVTVNAVGALSRKGDVTEGEVMEYLADKGITVTSDEVAEVIKWFTDLGPFCAKLGRIDRIAKCCLLDDRRPLFLFAENHELTDADLHACIMAVMQRNNLLAYLSEDYPKIFTNNYDNMCRSFTTSSGITTSLMHRALFGPQWANHCIPIDDPNRSHLDYYERTLFMHKYMCDYPTSPQGRAAIETLGGKGRILSCNLGGNHVSDLIESPVDRGRGPVRIEQARQDGLLGELQKQFVPVSIKLYPANDSFDCFDEDEIPLAFKDFVVPDLLWWLFRDRDTLEAFANSFDPSGKSKGELVRSLQDISPFVKTIAAEGVFTASLRKKREELLPEWRRAFAPNPYVTDPGVGPVPSAYDRPSR